MTVLEDLTSASVENTEAVPFDTEVDLKFQLREISPEVAFSVIKEVGFDETYQAVAARKFDHQLLFAESLRSPAANILKQTCLTVGAEAATHKQVITCKVDEAPVLISATQGQLDHILKKLRPQPFGLSAFSQAVNRLKKRQQWVKHQPTQLVAVLNITPDSFSDGGSWFEDNHQLCEKKLIAQLEAWQASGLVDVVDIGAESTRPSSKEISVEEEIERLKPVFRIIAQHFPQLKLSLDTRKSVVAQFGLDNGVKIINDVSGFEFDPKMVNVVSQYPCHYILTHAQGVPETMQENPTYQSVVREVSAYFYQKIATLVEAGVTPENIILDPGFGFGKTQAHNMALLSRLSEIVSIGFPLMVGVSRKRFLQPPKMTEFAPLEKEYLTTSALTIAYLQGAKYFRLHNVEAQAPVLQWLKQIQP